MHTAHLLRKRPSVTSKLSIASSSFALDTSCAQQSIARGKRMWNWEKAFAWEENKSESSIEVHF